MPTVLFKIKQLNKQIDEILKMSSNSIQLTSVGGTLSRHCFSELAAVDMAGKPNRRASPLTRATLSRDMASATKAASQRQEHSKKE
jgi:hypothetical protein